MSSDSNWIKEISETYLTEEARRRYIPTAVEAAGKKPSYVKPMKKEETEEKKKQVSENTEECLPCLEESTITNEQLVESVNYLTEEQQNLFVLSFVDDLLENFSWEEIDALTEEQLEEGLMAKLKGYAGGALAAAKSAPISQFLSKAKQYGAERTERFEKQEAETAHTKELEKARGEAKGGVRRATDAELHSIVNKLGKSKGAANKAILAKAQETLGRRAEDAAGKGLGGLVAKTRGLLGNKAAMRERVAKMAERSKTAAGKVNVDAGATVAAARRGHKKTTVANIQALRARGKETSKEIGRLKKTLPDGK